MPALNHGSLEVNRTPIIRLTAESFAFKLPENKTLWCFDFLRWLNNTKSLGKSSTIGQGPKYIVCRTRTSPLTSVSVTITQQYIVFSRASLAELRDVRIRCPISSTKKIFFLLMDFTSKPRMHFYILAIHTSQC